MARGDLADMMERVRREGFHFLEDDELQEYVAQAVEFVGYERQWALRRSLARGLPPVVQGSGFDRVISVIDDLTGNALAEDERTEIVRRGGRLTDPGQPQVWYFDYSGAIATWPVSSNTILVEFVSRSVWTEGGLEPSATVDSPLMPQLARSAAVLLAQALAYEAIGAPDAGAGKRALVPGMIETAFASESRRVTQRSVRVVD